MRTVTTAQHRIPDHDIDGRGALRIRLQPALCPTDDQFYEFCRINRELRMSPRDRIDSGSATFARTSSIIEEKCIRETAE